MGDWYQLAVEKTEINEVPYEEFSEKPTLIGCGGFGRIYKTRCNSIGIVAIKEITIILEDENCNKNFTNELKIHSRLKHERIIRFYGISRNIDKGYLILEYANQGNLREFLGKYSLEWEERVRLAVQIAEGLQYLHEKLNIAHRDLHTKNILMNDRNVKISDFGLSKNLYSANISGNKIIGVPPFIDPQKLNSSNFKLDKKSDIYSLGVILWEISSCRTPFPNDDVTTITLKVCHGIRERHVKGTPIKYIGIYTDCWKLGPESRPLIDDVRSRLESVTLKPVFGGDNVNFTNSLPPPDTSTRNSTSEYSSNVSYLTIPDGITFTTNISSSANSFIPTSNAICKECGSQFTDHDWCCECEAQKFQINFPNWTSGNESLDKLIQYSQLNAIKYNKYFEWINFNRLVNVIRDEIYTATWIDGIRELWDDKSQQWVRTESVKIVLRKFSNPNIKNLKLHLDLKNNIIRCYGFTRCPLTESYYMVLKYANKGNLRQYIKNKFPCSWFERLSILRKIVESIYKIHKANYIHCNLHPGSILLHEDDWNHELEIYISSLDLCIYGANKVERELKIYSSVPHIAPEIIVGKIVSAKSDIYSLGVIMWELASGDEPYSGYGIDNENKLIRDIIDGVRPNNIVGTPQCYHELMQKCLDTDPEKRPNTLNLLEELKKFTEIPLKRQFEATNRRIRGQPQPKPPPPPPIQLDSADFLAAQNYNKIFYKNYYYGFGRENVWE